MRTGEEERFATAVDRGTAPASVRGDRGGAHDLARELELVALLRAGGARLAPEPAARERARGRLMAAFAQEFGAGEFGTEEFGAGEFGAGGVGTGTFGRAGSRAEEARPAVAEVSRTGRHAAPDLDGPGDDAPETPGVRRLRPHRSGGADRGVRAHRRGALVGAAAAAALVALATGGTFASQDALPGDTLYSVKRVAESTGYALTFGERAKARRHLEQAQRRLDEVEGLVAREGTATPAGGRAADAELVQATMQEFDADTDQGARLLLAGAGPDAPPDTAEVQEVRSWATQQSGRLARIRSEMPAPQQADDSLALLDRVLGRTAALSDPALSDPAVSDPTLSDPTCAAADPAEVCRTAVPADGRGTPGSDRPGTSDGARATGTAGPDGDRPGGDPGRDAPAPGSDADPDESDGADAGGEPGSGDVSVPAPVPGAVRVPSPGGGLPGVRLGGG